MKKYLRDLRRGYVTKTYNKIDVTYKKSNIDKAIRGDWDSMMFMEGTELLKLTTENFKVTLEPVGIRVFKNIYTNELLHGIYDYAEIDEIFDNNLLDEWEYHRENKFQIIIQKKIYIESSKKTRFGVFEEITFREKPQSFEELLSCVYKLISPELEKEVKIA